MENRLSAVGCALLATAILTGCSAGDEPAKYVEYALQGAYSATLSPQSKYAVIGSFNHGGSLWNVTQHERLYNWNHRAGEYSLIAASAFSPDERYAATANQQDLVLWNLSNGKPEGFWSSPAEILAMDLSPNGDYALLGLADHTAVYFDVKRGGIKQTFRHSARVKSVDLSEDALLALTGDDDYNAQLWDVQSNKVIHSLKLGNIVDTVALSPNKQLAFSSGSLDRALIWSTRDGQILHTLSDNRDLFGRRLSFLSARFSPDNSQLLTGTASGTVQLWNTSNGNLLRSWEIHKRDPYGPTSTGVYSVGFGSGVYYAIGSNGIINELK
ncbi:WD40 repeat domain-containing protein [Amphritea sp.]|uniref:WD40 repeat domain-containing protein n=1 Tax=Amphritea sp. TaxID=1872502 RepID=UPI003D13C0E4